MITASMATYKGREKYLDLAINSLLPQVDRLNIYFNYTPENVNFDDEKIQYEIGDNRYRDTAKFWWSNKVDGWHLICDDDIIYPEGYAEYMTRKAEKYGVVSLAGRNYPKRQIKSYYHDLDMKNLFRALGDINKMHKVELLVTCSVCYHSDTIQVDVEKEFFETLNADIWFSAMCKMRDIDMRVVPHSADYLIYMNPGDTIYKKYSQDDKLQTKVFNEYFR